MKFAGEKHKSQLVPGTEANYLLHIANVSMEILMAHRHSQNFNLEFALQVAILHDCLEDTETSEEELASVFGKGVTSAVRSLTKNPLLPKSDRMTDCLHRIRKHTKEVTMVKLADRITNLQPPPAHWSAEKCVNYAVEAEIIADELSGANDFLDDRIRQKITDYKELIPAD